VFSSRRHGSEQAWPSRLGRDARLSRGRQPESSQLDQTRKHGPLLFRSGAATWTAHAFHSPLLPRRPHGLVELAQLEAALRPDTVLVLTRDGRKQRTIEGCFSALRSSIAASLCRRLGIIAFMCTAPQAFRPDPLQAGRSCGILICL